MSKQIKNSIVTFSIVAIFLGACDKTDEPLPQLLAGFNSTSLGLSLEESQKSVSVELSRVSNEITEVMLTIIEAEGTVYGVDYETEPAAEEGQITLEIPANATSGELTIKKLKNPEFEETKSFNVTITGVSREGTAGNNHTLEVSFEENPTSSGAILNPEVGGPEQPNQVFVDLSKQSATAVSKSSWDLAFSNGDEFRVMLNYATYTMARVTDKTDLADITDADITEEYKAEMVAGQANTEYMDDPAGDLSLSTIAEISANESENFVYVVNRGQLDTNPATERGFVKLRITKSGDDYLITYGEINDTDNFSSTTIAKSDLTNFIYFSFDDGIVEVEPEITKWDFVMTTFTHEVPNGDEVLSYKYKDFVLTNSKNMSVAPVQIGGDVTYEGFSRSDVEGITLAKDRLGIGSSWRLFDFSTYSYTINPSIFYVIEDPDGNFYKLKFTKMVNDQGDRGYPELVYELL
jgi:hypothetical protein